MKKTTLILAVNRFYVTNPQRRNPRTRYPQVLVRFGYFHLYVLPTSPESNWRKKKKKKPFLFFLLWPREFPVATFSCAQWNSYCKIKKKINLNSQNRMRWEKRIKVFSFLFVSTLYFHAQHKLFQHHYTLLLITYNLLDKFYIFFFFLLN